MNRIKQLLTFNKAMGQYDLIVKEIDIMDAKHLFMSRTFWMNVAELGLTLTGVLPHKYAPYVAAVSNMIMRVLSNQPIWVFNKPLGQ